VLAALKATLGSGGWFDRDADMAPYLSDFRRQFHGATALVADRTVSPRVCRVHCDLRREHIGVVPHGGQHELLRRCHAAREWRGKSCFSLARF